MQDDEPRGVRNKHVGGRGGTRSVQNSALSTFLWFCTWHFPTSFRVAAKALQTINYVTVCERRIMSMFGELDLSEHRQALPEFFTYMAGH